MQPEDLIKADENGCWIWQPRMTPSEESPSITTTKGLWRVHHLLWMKWKNRPLPYGVSLRRTCKNKRCVNPQHREMSLCAGFKGFDVLDPRASEFPDIAEIDLIDLFLAQRNIPRLESTDPTVDALLEAVSRKQPKPGCIYFIRATDGGPIKVGYTGGSPSERLAALQTGASSPLYCMASISGSYHLERTLHSILAPYRLHGEWFSPSPVLLGFISALNSPIATNTEQKPGILEPIMAF